MPVISFSKTIHRSVLKTTAYHGCFLFLIFSNSCLAILFSFAFFHATSLHIPFSRFSRYLIEISTVSERIWARRSASFDNIVIFYKRKGVVAYHAFLRLPLVRNMTRGFVRSRFNPRDRIEYPMAAFTVMFLTQDHFSVIWIRHERALNGLSTDRASNDSFVKNHRSNPLFMIGGGGGKGERVFFPHRTHSSTT